VDEALNCTAPNCIALNQTMWSQTMARVTKLSREISVLLRYYTASYGISLWTYRDNLSVPIWRVNKSKREKRAWLKL